LGIPANLDQLLNMQFIVNSGSGASIRADCLSKEMITGLVRRMLSEPSYKDSAARVAGWFAAYSATDRFCTVIDKLLTENKKFQ
jgi:UDP:flavonoid glycosyltransferase YjiC (YdhE family)